MPWWPVEHFFWVVCECLSVSRKDWCKSVDWERKTRPQCWRAPSSGLVAQLGHTGQKKGLCLGLPPPFLSSHSLSTCFTLSLSLSPFWSKRPLFPLAFGHQTLDSWAFGFGTCTRVLPGPLRPLASDWGLHCWLSLFWGFQSWTETCYQPLWESHYWLLSSSSLQKAYLGT